MRSQTAFQRVDISSIYKCVDSHSHHAVCKYQLSADGYGVIIAEHVILDQNITYQMFLGLQYLSDWQIVPFLRVEFLDTL